MTDPRQHWGQLSRAERDAAYNNGLHVADSAALNKARVEASAIFRSTTPGHLDVPYGDATRQKWDLFPAKDPDAPCFVFIHGGYWQFNTREDFGALGAGLAAHGWSVAFPGYTLTPEASLTQIVNEITAALDWLAANGPAYGISGPVLLSGWSAGGHLTAMGVDHPLVTAALPISGVFELGPVRDTYLNVKLQLTDEEIVALSPLRLPVVHKPMTIAYGSAELAALVHDSRNLQAKRAAEHAPGALLPIAGANHFTIVKQLQDKDSTLVRAALDLMV
jgi:acetyl esterase/lipase